MNEVAQAIVFLVVGAACGGWAVWLLMRAGEKRLEQTIAEQQALLSVDEVAMRAVVADRAALVYDSEKTIDEWLWCGECNRMVYSSETGNWCGCKTVVHGQEQPATWQRVRVTARRIEQ